MDGRDLYGPTDNAAHPLPDDLHPDASSHQRIAERFTKQAFNGPFATSPNPRTPA
jgi:hypothetical protein